MESTVICRGTVFPLSEETFNNNVDIAGNLILNALKC